jgi:putative phosphoribosyl transferase
MPLFIDRADAGSTLARSLESYKKNPDTMILGLARGGVVVAHRVAELLQLPFDVIVVKKIGAPGNEELALGAVTDTGETFWNQDILSYLSVPPAILKREKQKQMDAARVRGEQYRGMRKPIDIHNKTVLLIDDGIATGASMHAAVQAVKERGAKKVIVAAPVASIESVQSLKELADEVICPHTPSNFAAVGAFYRDFFQTTDKDVMNLLKAR